MPQLGATTGLARWLASPPRKSDIPTDSAAINPNGTVTATSPL